MTSNAGSTDQSGATGFGKKPEVASADKSLKALQEFLRPEFLGRVDEIITFHPLSQENLERIAALMLDEYKPGLQNHGITLTYDQPALAAIVAQSSTKYGARELPPHHPQGGGGPRLGGAGGRPSGHRPRHRASGGPGRQTRAPTVNNKECL